MPHKPSQIRLVSLDFDGTILTYPESGPVLHEAVVDALNELNFRGIAWVANSGRSLDELKKIVEASTLNGLEHLPQAFLCLESLIYECSGVVFRSVEPWNSEMIETLRELHTRVRAALAPHLDEIRERFTTEIFLAEFYTTFNIPDSEEKLNALFGQLRKWLRDVKGASFTRSDTWCAVHSSRAGKGAVLRAFAARTGFEFDEILAIGDHFNDLTMLDGTAAGHVG